MVGLAFTLAGWLGCAGQWGNQPPVLVAVNGVRVDAQGDLPEGHPAFQVPPGGSLALTVELRDPEGDPVWLWVPRAPPGLRWPRRSRTALYQPPADARVEGIDLVLEDRRRRPRRRSSWRLPLHAPE